MTTKRWVIIVYVLAVLLLAEKPADGRDADDELLRSAMNLDRPGGCADRDGFWNASDQVVDYIKAYRPLTETQREAVYTAIVALSECKPEDARVAAILQERARKAQEELDAVQKRLDTRRACMETRF